MKRTKITAVFLALIMCLSLVLTSCDKVSVSSVKKDPMGTVISSSESTINDTLDKLSLTDTLKTVFKKGSVNFSFSQEDSIGVDATVFVDEEAQKAALTGNVELMGSKSDFSLYAKPNEIALSIPDLLGEDTYGVDMKNFEADLSKSEIWGLLGVTYDDVKSELGLEDALKTVNGVIGSEKNDEKLTEDVKALFAKTENTVEKKTVNVGGEDVKAVCVSYKLTKEFIREMCDFADKHGVAMDSMIDGVDEAVDELFEALQKVDGSIQFAINVKTGDIMRVDVTADMDLKVDEEVEAGRVKVYLDFGKKPSEAPKWELGFEVTDLTDGAESGDNASAKIVIDRENTADTFKRNLAIELKSTTDGEADEDIKANVTFVNDKKAKTFGLSAEADDAKFSLTGTLDYTATTLDMTVDKLTVDGESMDIGLKISAKAGAECPAMPEYKNILKLSADEYGELVGAVEEIAGMFGGGYEDPYDFDDPFGDDFDDDDFFGDGFEFPDAYFTYDPTFDYDEDGDVDTDDYAMFDVINSLMDQGFEEE